MKYFIVTFLALTVTSLIAQANCSLSAAQSALHIAKPNGNNLESSLYVSVGNSTLLTKQGKLLTYEIQIDFDVNDGASSDSFPSEVYRVSAQGTEQSCKIIAVQLKK